jgi:1,4-dihydroxy-2-naphthoyl-CoA hydrolase
MTRKEKAALTKRLRRRLKEGGATKLLGFTLEKMSKGRAAVRMDVDHRHKQLHGVVHGGVLAALADSAAAIAAYTVLRPGVELATVEMKINFLEAIGDGHARAVGRVLRAGRNFVVTECEIRTRKGRLAAKALLTFGAASGRTLRET